jgi:hypothetical protein
VSPVTGWEKSDINERENMGELALLKLLAGQNNMHAPSRSCPASVFGTKKQQPDPQAEWRAVAIHSRNRGCCLI